MPRKSPRASRSSDKNPEKTEKSTVIELRDTTDWGCLLYDSCWLFNRRLADYFIEYASQYDAGEVGAETAIAEATELSRRRDLILADQQRLHDAVERLKKLSIEEYSIYSKTTVPDSLIESWRSWQEGCDDGDLVRISQHEERAMACLERMGVRREALDKYRRTRRMTDEAVRDEREYIEAHLFETRELGTRASSLRKLAARHTARLSRPMLEDAEAIRGMLLSETMAEKLMALCLNLLDATSGCEFVMAPTDLREAVVEGIGKYFERHEHNYDFLTGCYEPDAGGALRLKDVAALPAKFYNGYYMTIRGFVRKAYDAAQFRRNCEVRIDDEGVHERQDDNPRLDVLVEDGSGRPATDAELYGVDDGLRGLWGDCAGWLMDHMDEMTADARRQSGPGCSLGRMRKGRLTEVFSATLARITEEMSGGRPVGRRFRDIVYDCVGGLSGSSDGRQTLAVVRTVLSKYMNRYAIKSFVEKYGSEYGGEFSDMLEEELSSQEDLGRPVRMTRNNLWT